MVSNCEVRIMVPNRFVIDESFCLHNFMYFKVMKNRLTKFESKLQTQIVHLNFDDIFHLHFIRVITLFTKPWSMCY